MEAILIVSLVLINFSLLGLYLVQRRSLSSAQKFLKGFLDNTDTLVNAIEKCIDIINKNAELLLQTSEKTNTLEEEVARLKVINNITKDYFVALETISEARRVAMPLSKRVYHLSKEE